MGCALLKTIRVIIILLLPNFCIATNYYVKIGGGSGSGLNDANAWSFAKFNSMSSFVAGDSILFKRGETFFGSIAITNSGNAGSPIVYGAYGTGAVTGTATYNLGVTATGTKGEIRFTATGIYICTATNTWIKCVGSTF